MRGTKGHIGYLLRQAHAVHKMRMEHALKTTGLTLPQFSVLTMLGSLPWCIGCRTGPAVLADATNHERDCQQP
ncbi:hypothetical protein [Pantoea ananatis]|uniref:hypothetical protein n=1 Tax=Pantoea ananas TaxID=553 RepID=UPI000AFFB754|nr:hypothetical protein [Pantoea ananatis]MDS7720887.1 hypothetical protein [Pantoea ananatis]